MRRQQGRVSLSGAAYSYLKEKLLEGAFAAGDSVSVEEVVSQLGGSRQPVMEALKQLAAEGFLEIIPQVGCRVVVADGQQIKDFFVILAQTEGLCAQLAAERATSEERRALAAIIERTTIPNRRAKATEIAHAYRVHNREFHSQIHAMAHSELVSDIATGLWDRSDFFISTAVGMHPFAERASNAVDEHRQIQRAISAGDCDRARQLMQRHIEAFRTEMGRSTTHPNGPSIAGRRRARAPA